MSRLKEKFEKEVLPKLKDEFGIENNFAVPRIKKVVLNTGIGRITKDSALVEGIFNDMERIAGQRPVYTQARKSIASFKVREGMNIGIKVTLRGKRMYDFIDRLISLSLPRTRDFKGIDPKCIDQAGNMTIGIREQIVFPEVNQETARGIFGLEITIVLNNYDKEVAKRLYKLLGFPLKA